MLFFQFFYNTVYSALLFSLVAYVFIIGVNLGEEDQNAYDINKLKKPVNGNIPGMDGKTLSEADTLLVRGIINILICIDY